MKRIFAFDMGKASIGYCVREDNEIKDLGSVIIEKDHSAVDANRTRRRAYRTLKAHREREIWFDKLWENNGLPVFSKTDDFFKREFAKKDDDTIYNSILLRCALIQGKKLELWQIYKALHNAIQRRGYDPNVAWANDSNEEEKKSSQSAKYYSQKNGVELIISDEFKYPAFYDALLLGLWEENNPYEFKRSIGLNPEKARRDARTAPRELVKKELIKLWEEAKKQLPQLQKISVEEFLYGDYREPYGSYKNPLWVKYRGKKEDWQGVLGQKIPRFDNRIISKCKLLPKRNVCSADTIENISFVLLMQLKNFRYTSTLTFESGLRLAPYEIKQIFDKKLPQWIESLEKYKRKELKNPSFTITKTDIEDVIGEKVKMENLKANISGRSSFCRRACQIMIDIIISGIEPNELDIEKYIDKEDSPNPITKDEIKQMLEKVGSSNELHIPDNRYELAEISQNADKESDLLIGNITNPIVRNRLQIFKNLLANLIKDGKPDEVIFEFVRDKADDSLFGKIKADETANYMKEQEKENKQIIDELVEHELDPKKYFLMHKLLRMQKYECIYCGKRIEPTEYDACDIDHIFPYSRSQNDSLYNKVVCHREENQKDKKDKTPYEWLFNDKNRWSEYTKRVLSLKKTLGKKKVDLLTLSPEKCEKLIKTYNGLAETAQVAKVASAITHFMCGWGMQTKGDSRHVFVENGSTTSKIRKSYKLNSILGDDEKKNRSNPKHHALDAICISYAMDYKCDPITHKFYAQGLKRDYVEQKINELMPFPYKHKKPLKADLLPDATTYGKLQINEKQAFLTQRIELIKIEQKNDKINNIVDSVIKEDLMKKLEEKMNNEDWINMLKNYVHPKKKTTVKKVLVKLSNKPCEIDYDINGRQRLGEYVDFGTKGTKGQFKHSKQHRGQILYFDKKGAVKVMPIYANKSKKEILEMLQEMGCKLYRNGEMFSTGCLIEVPNDFKAADITYPKGTYKIRTIEQGGTTMIESSVGDKPRLNIKYLVNAGFYKKQY